MRISFTGAAGIGKTTLARALSDRLGIPVIEENFQPIAKAFNPASPTESRDEQLVRCRSACLTWLDQRAAAYDRHEDFVEDRCAIDILFRWLAKNISDRDNRQTLEILTAVRNLLARTDCLVILPLVLTEEARNEDGLIRVSSFSRLLKAQSLAIGIAHQFLDPAKLLFVPRDCQTIEARVEYILRQLRS